MILLKWWHPEWTSHRVQTVWGQPTWRLSHRHLTPLFSNEDRQKQAAATIIDFKYEPTFPQNNNPIHTLVTLAFCRIEAVRLYLCLYSGGENEISSLSSVTSWARATSPDIITYDVLALYHPFQSLWLGQKQRLQMFKSYKHNKHIYVVTFSSSSSVTLSLLAQNLSFPHILTIIISTILPSGTLPEPVLLFSIFSF